MLDENIFLKEGYTIYVDEPLNKYYKVVRREPFSYITGNETPVIFSTVASGSETGFKNIDALEPDDDPMHIFQVLWGVADYDPVKYYMKIPSGQNRFGLDNDKEIGFVDAAISPWFNPSALFQFWLKPDWIPAINCKNGSACVITPKIYFQGMKYDVAALTKDQAGTIYKKVVFGGVKNTP